MLHIILYILKIIGIILLVILGLLLLMLLAVLFVPLRYKFNVRVKDEELYFDGTISWLLHLIHGRIKKDEGEFQIWLRILAIKVFDSQKMDKRRKAKQEESKKPSHRDVDLSEEITDKEPPKESSKEPHKEPPKAEKIVEEYIEFEEKLSFMGKINNKIQNIIDKIKKVLKNIKDKIINFFKKIFDIRRKTILLVEFIRDEINKKGFKVVYESLKGILKHLMPTDLELELLFGTGDPCTTGQTLGVLSILYSLYGDHIEIRADFEQKIIEGRLDVKGRIRLVRLIIIVIKLISNKRFKELNNNFKTLKEAL